MMNELKNELKLQRNFKKKKKKHTEMLPSEFYKFTFFSTFKT